jgi:2-methylcitrate dehydratase PrpD
MVNFPVDATAFAVLGMLELNTESFDAALAAAGPTNGGRRQSRSRE